VKKSEVIELIKEELLRVELLKESNWQSQKSDVHKIYDKGIERLSKYLEKEFTKVYKKYDLDIDKLESLLRIVVDNSEIMSDVYRALYPIDDIE